MKLINLLLLFLPILGYSQVDTSNMSNVGIKVDSLVFGDYKIVGDKMYTKKRPEPKLYGLPEVPKNIGVVTDSLPTNGGITTQRLNEYNGTFWFGSRYSTEIKKGVVKTPVQVMDSGIKVEVFETRDTLYDCPSSYGSVTYFNVNGTVEKAKDFTDCIFDKVVTCRTYRFYIINEEGKKEYLSMDISKNK